MAIHPKQILCSVALLVIATASQANPLCASPEQRASIAAALEEAPTSSPAELARRFGVPEATVVQGLRSDMRVPVAMKEFEDVWQALTEWQDALIIVLSSESVFELFGPLPAGETARGYFNFDAPGSPYGGHLKTERLAAIYLLSTNGRNGETHQVAFYDREGNRVFSVYVPRDEDGVLQTQPHNRFLRLKEAYDNASRSSLLTATSCLRSAAVESVE